MSEKSQPVFAVHTVFIPRENFLFMEEWIDYHLQLGFGKFYLYDNSGSQGYDPWHRQRTSDKAIANFVPGKVNKYGVDYAELVDMDEARLGEALQQLARKYPGRLEFIDWAPLDENGKVHYGGPEAQADCLQRMKADGVDWCASIDMDEFVVFGEHGNPAACVAALPPGVNNIRMSQVQFRSRFHAIEELVIDADRGVPIPTGIACKNIYKVNKTDEVLGHEWHGEGEEWKPPHNAACFNHYVLKKLDKTAPLSNIDPNLHAVVRRNAHRYLRTRIKEGRQYAHTLQTRLGHVDAIPVKPRRAKKPRGIFRFRIFRQHRRGGRRILHYVSQFSMPTQTFIYDLIQRLEADTPHDNMVLHQRRLLDDSRPYAKTLQLSQQIPLETLTTVFRHLVESRGIELLIVHFAEKTRDLRRVEQATGIKLPMIVMTHGYDVFELRDPAKRRRVDYVVGELGRRDRVMFTAPSDYLAGELQNAGVAAERIAVVPNTVHPQFFQHRKTGDFYRGGRPLRLLSIGRLIDLKGHRFLLAALARFRRDCAPARLSIVYGDAADDLQPLQQQAASLGIADCVDFVPFVDLGADPAYLSRFDLYVHCSTYTDRPVRKSESFGIAALEAIASGLPVIATDAGATGGIVGYDSPHSRIVPHGSAAALFAAMKAMHAAPQETFTDNRRYAKNRLKVFSPQRQLAAIEEVIGRLTGPTP